jgi:hypothetical protein
MAESHIVFKEDSCSYCAGYDAKQRPAVKSTFGSQKKLYRNRFVGFCKVQSKFLIFSPSVRSMVCKKQQPFH